MTIELDLLEVMNKETVHETINKALETDSISSKLIDVYHDDGYIGANKCLFIEWPVNSKELKGAKGVMITGMSVTINCNETSGENGTVLEIGEVGYPDFYYDHDEEVYVPAVLIPDSTFYEFSTESLKPVIEKIFDNMNQEAADKSIKQETDTVMPASYYAAKAIFNQPSAHYHLVFKNNPRIHDEKLRLDKPTLAAVHDLLEINYHPEADEATLLDNLKEDLKLHHEIVLPDSYYVDEQLRYEILVYGNQSDY